MHKTKTPTREVSINISPRQFNDTDIAQTLPRALERHAVDPCLVGVELTESSVMNEIASIRRALDRDAIQGYLISKPMPPAASQPVARNVVLQEA